MRSCGVWQPPYNKPADEIVGEEPLTVHAVHGRKTYLGISMAYSREFDLGHPSCSAISSAGPALHSETVA